MITGADVVAFRTRRGMSRKALGQASGLSEGKIWRIEVKGVIHPDELTKLELLGVEVLTMPPPLTGVQVLQQTPTVAPPIYAKSPPIVTVVQRDEPVVDLAAAARVAERRFERYVSNSELQTWKRCRRKWWLAWHRGLHLRTESPVGVRQVGDRLHRALKSHYVPGGPPSGDTMLEALEREILLDRTKIAHERTDEETRKQFESEADLERIMLEGYVAWLAETGADAELEVIAPETYLEAELTEFEGRVAIIGKLDVRVRRTIDGVHLFIDHKSVGNLTQPTLLLPLDEQMLHYHLLEQLNLDGEGRRSDGAIYNMLRRVKRSTRATPPFYARVEVRHNAHELKSYRRRVVGEIQDMMEVAEQLEHGADPGTVAYPRPARECVWDCPFFSVCPMFDDGSRAEDMLTEYFAPGDPLEYYLTEMIGEEIE